MNRNGERGGKKKEKERESSWKLHKGRLTFKRTRKLT